MCWLLSSLLLASGRTKHARNKLITKYFSRARSKSVYRMLPVVYPPVVVSLSSCTCGLHYGGAQQKFTFPPPSISTFNPLHETLTGPGEGSPWGWRLVSSLTAEARLLPSTDQRIDSRHSVYSSSLVSTILWLNPTHSLQRRTLVHCIQLLFIVDFLWIPISPWSEVKWSLSTDAKPTSGQIMLKLANGMENWKNGKIIQHQCMYIVGCRVHPQLCWC